MTDRWDEAGEAADSPRGLWPRCAHISTQLHLQTDAWSEAGRTAKTTTDEAADGEKDRLGLEGPVQ